MQASLVADVDLFASFPALASALSDPDAALARLDAVDRDGIRAALDAGEQARRDLESFDGTREAFVLTALDAALPRDADGERAGVVELARALALPTTNELPLAEVARYAQGSVLAALGESGEVVTQVLGAPLAAVAEVASVKEAFDAPFGDPSERKVVEGATAWALPLARKVAPGVEAGTVAQVVDTGVTLAKGAYKLATGQLRASEVVDLVADRAATAIVAGIRTAAGKIGAKAGAAVGGFLAGFVGLAPVGAAAGAMVGRVAGHAVAEQIKSGVREVVRPLVEAGRALAQKTWEGVKSFGKALLGLGR